jgi:hypothetical protein
VSDFFAPISAGTKRLTGFLDLRTLLGFQLETKQQHQQRIRLLSTFFSKTLETQRQKAMDPGQLVVPVAGIVAAAALTFYLVSFQEMSNKSFEDLEEKLAKGTNNVLLNSSLSSKKRREARRISKQQRQQQASKPGSSPDSASSKD